MEGRKEGREGERERKGSESENGEDGKWFKLDLAHSHARSPTLTAAHGSASSSFAHLIDPAYKFAFSATAANNSQSAFPP